MWKREVGPGAMFAGAAALVLIVGVILWALFKPTGRRLSDDEQRKVDSEISQQYGQYFNQQKAGPGQVPAQPGAAVPPGSGAPGGRP